MDAEILAGALPASATAGAARLPIRAPSVLRCGLLILVIKLALKTVGFGRTVAWIRRRTDAISRAALINAELVWAVEHAVAMAAALYPGRAKCLEQSLVLYYLLRRRGAEVTYCQGVQARPFLAHAWVEYGGEPINDVAEHVRQFARLPEGLP